MFRAPLAALAVFVLAGLGLRVAGLDQTLYGDEYFTHAIVTRGGLGEVWDRVYTTSITPPLHYALAWLPVQLGGDSTVLARLPSIVLGTLTIPLAYLLGRRTGGTRAGLIAAALVALAPFSVWYSDEARAYATMMFLLALGALALLRAVAGDGRRWWALWALCSCAALWSHYTAVFVVAGMAGWAFLARPERRRAVLLAATAVAVGYAPWLPGFLAQRRNQLGIDSIDTFARLHLTTPLSVPANTLLGHPFHDLRTFPGVHGLLLVLVAAALLTWALVRARPALELRARLAADSGLLVLLALATPAGLLLYAATGTSLWLPRNLGASVPFLVLTVALVLGWASTRVPARAGAGALALLGLLYVALTVRSQAPEYRRPPFREASQWVARHAAPGAPVVEIPLALTPDPRLPPTSIDLYLPAGHRAIRTGSDFAVWRDLGEDDEVWLVAFRFSSTGAVRDAWAPRPPPRELLARAGRIGGPDGLARACRQRTFRGIFDVDGAGYRGRARGKLSGNGISWTFGRDIRVVRGAARGAVDRVSRPEQPVLEGWALPPAGGDQVDWVLSFRRRDGRLVAASAGGLARPDVAALVGERARHSGWRFSPLVPRGELAGLRTFAVVGRQATELPATPAAGRALR